MTFFIYFGMACLVGALALFLRYKGSTNDGDMWAGVLTFLLVAGGVIAFVVAGIISALF